MTTFNIHELSMKTTMLFDSVVIFFVERAVAVGVEVNVNQLIDQAKTLVNIVKFSLHLTLGECQQC
jgi:hypothetical protein